jgi:hypothetical protein
MYMLNVIIDFIIFLYRTNWQLCLIVGLINIQSYNEKHSETKGGVD